MKFLSVCSGIEAASVAWNPLGWHAAAVAEIEPFPRAVLKHHYPDVPNWGDITKFQEWPDADVDVLVGGTPCQSFSVAGLRKGLADPRGNLALTYLGIAARYKPRWLVWENVPGVLSSTSHDAPDPSPPAHDVAHGTEWVGEDEYDADESHAFVCFLAGLRELGYGFAYRSYDAQYFGLAQRRERVFVVGYLGDWRRAAAVFLESESLRGDPAPSRQPGQGFAANVAPSLTGSGRGVARPGESRGQDPVVAGTLSARTNGGGFPGTDKAADGYDIAVGVIPILEAGASPGASESDPRAGIGIGEIGDPMFTLQAGKQHAIGFSCKDHGADAALGLAPTLRAMGHDSSHANAGGQIAVAFDNRGREGGASFEGPHDTANIRAASSGSSRSYVAFQSKASASQSMNPNEISPALDSKSEGLAVAFGQNRTSGPVDVSHALNAHAGPHGRQDFESETFIAHSLRADGFDASEDGTGRGTPLVECREAVRRLTPKECCRLQGYEDDYLDILYRGKPAADGPKYKALGNSMAVPVMAHIGRRIALIDKL